MTIPTFRNTERYTRPQKDVPPHRANIPQTTKILLRHDVQHQNSKNWTNDHQSENYPPGRNALSTNNMGRRGQAATTFHSLYHPPHPTKSKETKTLALSIYHQPSPSPYANPLLLDPPQPHPQAFIHLNYQIPFLLSPERI